MLNASSGHPQCMEEVTGGKEVIVINVGGVRNESYKSTLKSIPGTRLANLVSDTTCETEFFFDRSSKTFIHILNYYRTGKLHCPDGVCGTLFREELAFWGISETDVEPCCWTNLMDHRDAEEALALFEEEEQPPEYGQGMWKTSEAWRAKIWALFDSPHSSSAAMIIAMISMLFILIAVTKQCLESTFWVFSTIENITVGNHSKEEMSFVLVGSPELALVEMICVIWFTFEFLVRIICCPDKHKFFQHILNIVDFVAILPFYLELCLPGPSSSVLEVPLQFLRVARCVRLLRIYKMMPHVMTTGIQALGLALRASLCELCLLGIAFFVALGVYATLIFYAEKNEEYTPFRNIFDAFWWGVVTMTTVGYGDMYPNTRLGMVIASLCALTGVLSTVMPLPILIYNFTKYYALAKAKHRRPVKGRRWEGPDTEHTHKEAIE